ncbi:MAG TPA: glycosyltransferase family 4 protein [Anaerolineales bacterium]|jgi:glycosyltransferase involved in cell wall biosynthesis
MTAPIRLLLVTKSTGGVAEYIRQLVAGLDKSEFAITVACLSEYGPNFADELSRLPGVKTFSLEMNRYKVDPFSDTRVMLALAAHMRREAYDLVHAHASKPGFLARLAAIGSGKPVLYSPHCFAFHAGAGKLKAWIIAFLEGLAARYLTTRIVTVASGESKLALRYGVGREDLFTTVYTGIDAQKFKLKVDRNALRQSLGVPAGASLVCSVGRLSDQKSPLDFVRMASFVHQQKPETHFVWIGDGPLEASSRALGKELGLESVLHFAGQRKNVPELLQVIDCFVLSSLWEGFPIVLLEAMAAGAPVVATDIPGNDEAVIPGMNGWLVPVHDPQALAVAVLEVLNEPARALLYKENARKRVEQKFTRQNMLDNLASIYRQVLADAGQRLPQTISGKESL